MDLAHSFLCAPGILLVPFLHVLLTEHLVCSGLALGFVGGLYFV